MRRMIWRRERRPTCKRQPLTEMEQDEEAKEEAKEEVKKAVEELEPGAKCEEMRVGA